jgi:hypothetical protein
MNSYVRCGLLGFVIVSFAAVAVPAAVRAQEIDFSRIGGFESMGTGTVRSGSPPKTIINDDERHAVFLTGSVSV